MYLRYNNKSSYFIARILACVMCAVISLLIINPSFCSLSMAPWISEDVRFVREMNVGWNLSNTLDSHGIKLQSPTVKDFETFWGNPYTTKEMITAIKEKGFNSIRIPVTWYEHMDADYNVDGKWMERVAQIVDYCVQNDLYVIINAHHDTWYTPDDAHIVSGEIITKKLWKQIAKRFEDYNEKLLFESMNEPRLIGTPNEWNEGTPRARALVNRLNRVFVETVRSAGGYNPQRYLVLPTYCAHTASAALNDFRLPDSRRLIVSVHLYRPDGFALDEKGTSVWDASNKDDVAEINQAMQDLDRLFIKKGIPVIIGEFGALDKSNEEMRAKWTSFIVKNAVKRNAPCFWWDDTLFNRKTLEWQHPQILDALLQKDAN